MTDTAAPPPRIHPFERANLGKAPFRVVGNYVAKYQACPGAPIQPGAACDYCGTGIMDVYVVRSADKREFEVGCDCVARVRQECAGTDFEREARKMHDEINRIKRQAKHAAVDARVARVAALVEAHREELAEIVQPARYLGGRDQSVLRWAEWMLGHAGRKGKVEVCRRIEAIAEERGWGPAADQEVNTMHLDAVMMDRNAGGQ